MFCPFHSFIHLFIHSFVRLFQRTNIHSLIMYSFIHSSIHSFLRHFNHSCAYSPVIKMSLWPTKAIDLCAQRRQRLASASTQSDQSRHCLYEEILGSYLPTEHKVEALIRLCRCTSKSSLDAYDILLFRCCFCVCFCFFCCCFFVVVVFFFFFFFLFCGSDYVVYTIKGRICRERRGRESCYSFFTKGCYSCFTKIKLNQRERERERDVIPFLPKVVIPALPK